MTLSAVIARELRTRARQGTTYWARCGAAALAGIFAVHSAASLAVGVGPAAVGKTTFLSLSWLGLLAACASVATTADCISLERREGTLGLLFLTGLRTSEVVCAKLCAAGLTVLFSLMGGMPALAVALLWGGVTAGEVTRTALSLFSVFFVSLACGLFTSARANAQVDAFRRAGLGIAALFLIPWLAAGLLSPIGTWSWTLSALSPFRSFHQAADAAYKAHPLQYWLALGITVAETVLFLFGAAVFLRANWGQMERPQLAKAHPLLARAKPAAFKKRAFRDRHGWLLEKNPICWLSLRLHDQSALIWVGAFLMIFSGPVISVVVMTKFGIGGAGAGISLFSSFVPAIIFAWAAGKFFLEARQNGELELLLSTPLGGRDIVQGRWNALLMRFRGPLLFAGFMLFLEFVFATGSGSATFSRSMAPLIRVLDAVAVFWVGMWFGVRVERLISVVVRSVGLVMVLPWAVAYFCLTVLSIGGGMPGSTFFVWSLFWPVFCLAKDAFLIWWAAGKLKNELRTVAPLRVGDWLKEPEELLTRSPRQPFAREVASPLSQE